MERKIIYAEDNVDIEEMARVCWVPENDVGGIEIYIHSNDGGYVPHFHVRNYSEGWETCIRFDKAEYFFHGKYKDKLPKGIAVKLNSVLKSKNKRYSKSNWEIAIMMWNLNNSGVDLDDDMKQPDYSKL